MTTGELKPWSQVEDETGDATVEIAAAADQPSYGTQPARSFPSSGIKPPAAWMKVSSIWALAPMGLALIWILWAAIGSTGGASLSWSHAIGIGMLIVLAAGVLIHARHVRHLAMANLRASIGRHTGNTQPKLDDSPIGAEFKPLWDLMDRHATNVQHRLGELLDERKKLGLELSLADVRKRQAEAILHSIADPVLVTDAFDQLVMVNPQAEELLCITRDQALRQPVGTLISDEKLLIAIRQAREADGRAANRRIELEIASRIFSVTLSPVASETTAGVGAGHNHGVVVIFRDVTREREAAKMKSEFVAHVSHELRTPLASIRAYVEMLVDGEAADEKTRKEYCEIIQSSADRLGRLIDNMLNISRIEAGTVRVNKEPISVSMICKEAFDAVRPQAEEKGQTLTEELPPVMYRILADRDLILEAVLNLLSNAVKYTPEGGQVTMRMIPQNENTRIRIEVTDSGVGIPQEDIPRMFEKFFRVEANKKVAKGTGLGLNLVKQVVETIHGGELTLTSKVGEGSTFGIVLPLVK